MPIKSFFAQNHLVANKKDIERELNGRSTPVNNDEVDSSSSSEISNCENIISVFETSRPRSSNENQNEITNEYFNEVTNEEFNLFSRLNNSISQNKMVIDKIKMRKQYSAYELNETLQSDISTENENENDARKIRLLKRICEYRKKKILELESEINGLQEEKLFIEDHSLDRIKVRPFNFFSSNYFKIIGSYLKRNIRP